MRWEISRVADVRQSQTINAWCFPPSSHLRGDKFYWHADKKPNHPNTQCWENSSFRFWREWTIKKRKVNQIHTDGLTRIKTYFFLLSTSNLPLIQINLLFYFDRCDFVFTKAHWLIYSTASKFVKDSLLPK